jgi:hypothetical protein
MKDQPYTTEIALEACATDRALRLRSRAAVRTISAIWDAALHCWPSVTRQADGLRCDEGGPIAKQKKTAAELAAIIMQELRKRPELNRILFVTVIPPFEQNPVNPNWDVAFTVEGNLRAPELAYRLARALRAEFDLY